MATVLIPGPAQKEREFGRFRFLGTVNQARVIVYDLHRLYTVYTDYVLRSQSTIECIILMSFVVFVVSYYNLFFGTRLLLFIFVCGLLKRSSPQYSTLFISLK